MDNIEKILGKAVYDARDAAGYTQSQLAEMLNVDSKSILNIENFRGNPKFNLLYPLIRTLKIESNKIFYPELEISGSDKTQLLFEIQTCSNAEAAELLRVVRYMLTLLRKQEPPSVETKEDL